MLMGGVCGTCPALLYVGQRIVTWCAVLKNHPVSQTMNSSTSPNADDHRLGSPEVLHEAVEAMLETARRLASEPSAHPFPAESVTHDSALAKTFGKTSGPDERAAFQAGIAPNSALSLCYAAGAGVLLSLLLRKN